MAPHNPHPVLNRNTARSLARLSDPECAAAEHWPVLTREEAGLLFQAAIKHGVQSVIYRHARERAAATHAQGGGDDALVEAAQAAKPAILASVGHNLRLRHRSAEVIAGLRGRGIDCAIVKGPVFATGLYANEADRLYADIDIMIDRADVERTGKVMKQLGFAPDFVPGEATHANGQYLWVDRTAPGVYVELQTNLVHSVRLRRRMSVDRASIVEAGAGNPHDATAMLFVAALHASVGHQFERLTLVSDVVQAVRGRAGPIDVARLARVAASTGTTRAVATSLYVAGRVRDEPACRDLARELLPGRFRLEWVMVTPSIVLRSQSKARWRTSWRPRLLRQAITRPTPGTNVVG